MKPGPPRVPDPRARLIAWSAIVFCTVPDIIWRDAGQRMSLLFTASVALPVVVAAIAVRAFPGLRGLSRFLLAVAALDFSWGYVAPALAGTDFIRSLTNGADWGARLFFTRMTTLSGALLAGLTLIGSGLTRRDLFLCLGDVAAPAQPIGFLGLRKPIPWTWFGPAVILVFSLVLASFLYSSVNPEFGVSDRILRALPWILAIAALNAASEEFQFRNLILAHLRNLFSPAEAVLLSATFFALGHYFGHPSGLTGVAMAGFAGWIWARSMIETGGSFWAFVIHLGQDIVILTFLAVAVAPAR
ncbi:MAG TPA: CPBP family intramembrane glutamic endopeptidase [Chthoniobacterales bacterium]|nr:CPBP family intramembrane glutamic endopeptidase [Chthoniobacterales bacterium]